MSKQANKRQNEILNFIDNQNKVSISQIFDYINKKISKVSKITINRDLGHLLELNLITQKGSGRSVGYSLSSQFNLLKEINIEKYFSIDGDKRVINEKFNFDILKNLTNLFSEKEIDNLQTTDQTYQKNIKKLSPVILKKEFERLIIEFSWKSSEIEGNTYSLLETEYLIKEHKEPAGHTSDERKMILNHKKALDYIIKNREKFKTISLRKIEDVHSILISGLGVSKNLRKNIVRITGTRYFPLDNQFQIKEAIEKVCKVVNKEKNSFAKALILMTFIAYIQPFEDGNKRTARLISNAILLAYNLCPLSYRSIDTIEYKKAIILFYEQNNINYMKQLFIEQFEFAVDNYF